MKIPVMPEGVERSLLVDYWDGLLKTTVAFWQDQARYVLDVHDRLMKGDKMSSRWLSSDLRRQWKIWSTLVSYPATWWRQYRGDRVSSLLFTINPNHELPDPMEVKLPASVAGQPVQVTPMQRVGGQGQLEEAFVRLDAKAIQGNRLRLELVSLGRRPGADPGPEPELYAGAVYIPKGEERIPLARVYVLIEPEREAGEPAPAPAPLEAAPAAPTAPSR